MPPSPHRARISLRLRLALLVAIVVSAVILAIAALREVMRSLVACAPAAWIALRLFGVAAPAGAEAVMTAVQSTAATPAAVAMRVIRRMSGSCPLDPGQARASMALIRAARR